MRAAIILATVFASETALACPQCAFKDKAGLGSWFVLAGMILFPFFVVGGVLYAFRKLAIFEGSQ